MKKIITLFAIMLSMFAVAQENGEYMYIFRNNTIERIPVSEIDSVTFVDPSITETPDVPDAPQLASGVYLGILGFNQQLYSYPVCVLTKENKSEFNAFVDGLTMKNGTLLYYSVDQAINTLQAAQMPDDVSTAAIVTFTDGLDQGSIMMNGSYQQSSEYLNALNRRIMNETVCGQPITAYSIGLRGSDVTDVTTFRNNLSKLASSQENATEVTSMSEVNAKFKEIAEQLSQSNYFQTINLTIPGVSNGTVIRFTFDNATSAAKSSLYIEGTFNLSTRSLDNVKYVGLTSSSGTNVRGIVDGIFVSFTFEDVHAENNKLIDKQSVDEWSYISSNGTWQINSEFDKTENTNIVTERSSAVIMLVLDCSSSLAGDFSKVQSNAKDFINTLCDAAPDGDNSSTSPYEAVDLGLSVKWASCNVGANAPEEYGDYFAWGEISPKSSYYESNSVTYGKEMSDISGNAQYDAARANWGGNWRMPTLAEIKELYRNCSWKWTTQNGVNGYRVTGPNGNSIFVPAAGYRYGTSPDNEGYCSYYWSSTPYESDSNYAYYLGFDGSNYFWHYSYRHIGQSVRPVLE
ncbi:MAG: DUF1566 domain-containing protein [Bacteroidaceae bacterium]|nr:DUF1566 domain-containing protein [Bacteroidaceae bacterium]